LAIFGAPGGDAPDSTDPVTFQEEVDEMNVQEMIELAERTCGAVGRLGEDVEMATDDVLNDPDQSSPVGREHGELLRVVAELLELAGGLARAWEHHTRACNITLCEPLSENGRRLLDLHANGGSSHEMN
jgi:hypothetical protein